LRVRNALAHAQLRRFRSHIPDAAGGVSEGRAFSTFSIPYSLGVLALAGGISVLLLASEAVVPPLIERWVALFKIQEIFAFPPIEGRLIGQAYHTLVVLLLALVTLRLFLVLLRLASGVLALLPDRLLVVESNFLRSRIHHIPYRKILHLSAEETLVHRVLDLGYVELYTGERPAPLRFGPIPGFSAFISRLSAQIQRP
jgi:hypothetical protein